MLPTWISVERQLFLSPLPNKQPCSACFVKPINSYVPSTTSYLAALSLDEYSDPPKETIRTLTIVSGHGCCHQIVHPGSQHDGHFFREPVSFPNYRGWGELQFNPSRSHQRTLGGKPQIFRNGSRVMKPCCDGHIYSQSYG